MLIYLFLLLLKTHHPQTRTTGVSHLCHLGAQLIPYEVASRECPNAGGAPSYVGGKKATI